MRARLVTLAALTRKEMSESSVANRIAFYIYSLDQGGAERVTSVLANKFSEFGVEVTIFVMKPVSTYSYTLADNVRVVNLSDDASLGLSRKNSLLFNLKRILVLRKMVKRYSPQVLYTMMVNANVIGVISLIGCGIPCVISERNDPSQYEVGSVWRLLRKITYGFSYSTVSQTSRAQSWLAQYTNAKRIVVIPNPIEFPIRDGLPFVAVPDERGKMIVAVGRLCEQKQFDHLISAFSHLSADFPDWRVSILGDGKDRAELRKQIGQHGLTSKITLVGRVGNIGDWYRAASMFVMTSRYEGYPNALVEAMVSGVPVISYDCPSGPAELIQNGVNGWLVEVNNKEDLVEKMRNVMNDTAHAEKVGIEAEKIRKPLAADSIATQWLAVADLDKPA